MAWKWIVKTEIFKYKSIIIVAAPCMLIVLSPLFVQLMHTNYYKIVKQLKSFKIITVAATRFGLHKPSSGSSQPVLRQSYKVDFGKHVGANVIILIDFNCLIIL